MAHDLLALTAYSYLEFRAALYATMLSVIFRHVFEWGFCFSSDDLVVEAVEYHVVRLIMFYLVSVLSFSSEAYFGSLCSKFSRTVPVFRCLAWSILVHYVLFAQGFYNSLERFSAYPWVNCCSDGLSLGILVRLGSSCLWYIVEDAHLGTALSRFYLAYFNYLLNYIVPNGSFYCVSVDAFFTVCFDSLFA